MSNGANRLFKVIKQTSENTNTPPSQVVSLTVKSVQPLIFMQDDRLEITEDFCIFSKSVNINEFHIGDIVIAMVFNDGQVYYIQQNDSDNTDGNYANLSNKPKINGVELTEDKSAEDLYLINTDDFYYKSGDVLNIPYIVVSGMITSGTTFIALPIYTPKRLDKINDVIINTFKMEARGIKGYLNGTAGTIDFLNIGGYTLAANKRTNNLITIAMTKSSIFTNVDNNTPVVFTGEISLTFN